MPRPPRKQLEGALYHVTSRGNGRARIFFDDADHARFLDQQRDGLESYQVVLYAYVLMPNPYHLLVRTPRANLARFMQRLNTSYALYSRYKHKKPGHRLEGRLSGLTQRAIGTHYGGISSQAVGLARKRVNVRSLSEALLRLQASIRDRTHHA